MNSESLGKIFLHELKAEVPATRKCLERIPMDLSNWKPHERSMELGYLTLLVAEMPKWIVDMIVKSKIDIGSGTNYEKPKTTEELVKLFDDYVTQAKEVLQNVSDEELSEDFQLTNGDQVLISSPKDENISSTLNYWVHHRGQLTVYMRLNEIPVPSIYGPSADDPSF